MFCLDSEHGIDDHGTYIGRAQAPIDSVSWKCSLKRATYWRIAN